MEFGFLTIGEVNTTGSLLKLMLDRVIYHTLPAISVIEKSERIPLVKCANECSVHGVLILFFILCRKCGNFSCVILIS